MALTAGGVALPATKTAESWRDVLPIHPAAEMIPPMTAAELVELGNDIKANGLQIPIVLFAENGAESLLDGRSRLDALEAIGVDCTRRKGDQPDRHRIRVVADIDPYVFVLSANIHRRHLAQEQKRELIANVLKAKPDWSNSKIAKQVKRDDKTVAKVRRELEVTSEIPKLEKTEGKDGKARPTRRKKPAPTVAPEPEPTVAAPSKNGVLAASAVSTPTTTGDSKVKAKPKMAHDLVRDAAVKAKAKMARDLIRDAVQLVGSRVDVATMAFVLLTKAERKEFIECVAQGRAHS